MKWKIYRASCLYVFSVLFLACAVDSLDQLAVLAAAMVLGGMIMFSVMMPEKTK